MALHVEHGTGALHAEHVEQPVEQAEQPDSLITGDSDSVTTGCIAVTGATETGRSTVVGTVVVASDDPHPL